MKCSSGCGTAAEVVASRQGEAAVLLLCWEHGKGLAILPGVRVRALRPGGLQRDHGIRRGGAG